MHEMLCISTLQTMNNVKHNIVTIAKYDNTAWNSHMHSIFMHLFTFYLPLISYRIKNDSYLPRSTAIQ
jgi:translation elongation factor EF-1alpha